MNDRDKQIEELAHEIFECIDRELIDKFIEDENGNLKSVQTVSIYSIAEHLLDKGYRLNADVLKSEKIVQKETLNEIIDKIKGTLYVCESYDKDSFTQDNIAGLKRALRLIGEFAKCKDIEVNE